MMDKQAQVIRVEFRQLSGSHRTQKEVRDYLKMLDGVDKSNRRILGKDAPVS